MKDTIQTVKESTLNIVTQGDNPIVELSGGFSTVVAIIIFVCALNGFWRLILDTVLVSMAGVVKYTLWKKPDHVQALEMKKLMADNKLSSIVAKIKISALITEKRRLNVELLESKKLANDLQEELHKLNEDHINDFDLLDDEDLNFDEDLK
jgi:ABC-type lipoprotein release transport system permease subunit